MSSPVFTIDIPYAAIGLGSAFFLSGTLFSLSHITLPTLRTSPAAQYTKLFAPISHYGARFVPFFTLFSSTSLCYAAYVSKQPQLYNAGFLVLGIFPWSAIVMNPLQKGLERHGARSDGHWEGDQDMAEEAGVLSGRWLMFNYIRSAFPLLGGMWAVRTLLIEYSGL